MLFLEKFHVSNVIKHTSQEPVQLMANNVPFATNTIVLPEYVAVSLKKRIHTVADKNEATESEPILSMDTLQVHGVTVYLASHC